MANRDFNKIKRTIQDFSLGAGESGSTSGGMVIVDTLPEVGDSNLLYKLPDGTIWSCVNSTEEKTICDLEVGKNYKLVESIAFGDLEDILGNVTGNHIDFFENQTYPMIQTEVDAETGNIKYAYNINSNDSAYYYMDNESTSEPIELQYTGAITESPDVEITQYFVDNLQEGSTLEDLIPLFQNSSHTEEVTESTWTQLGGGAPKFYLHRIYLGNPTECDRIDFTMNIYNSRPEPYTDIHDLEAYLISAGLNNTAEEIETHENHNGIICAKDAYSSASEAIILRKIDENCWYFRTGQYDTSYLGVNIYEDSVMTM